MRAQCGTDVSSICEQQSNHDNAWVAFPGQPTHFHEFNWTAVYYWYISNVAKCHTLMWYPSCPWWSNDGARGLKKNNFRAKLVHMVKHAHFVIIKKKKKYGRGNVGDFLTEIVYLSKLSKIQLIIIWNNIIIIFTNYAKHVLTNKNMIKLIVSKNHSASKNKV